MDVQQQREAGIHAIDDVPFDAGRWSRSLRREWRRGEHDEKQSSGETKEDESTHQVHPFPASRRVRGKGYTTVLTDYAERVSAS